MPEPILTPIRSASRRRAVYIFNTCIPDRLDSRSHAIMDENVHSTRILGGKIMRNIKILNFSGYLGSKCGSIEAGNTGNTRVSRENIVPCIGNGVTDRRNDAQPGDDYPALGQSDSNLRLL